ncbi:hypothetical protein CBM2599_B50304 [Cupriavidus taiwanensis]|nr:hypothetical protein CBM2600_B10689 [Cupriavidus taiwanensis]SOY96372.1 hypothetical protein CBM2599_B50304 [Cupriavidus taiwanensis]
MLPPAEVRYTGTFKSIRYLRVHDFVTVG